MVCLEGKKIIVTGTFGIYRMMDSERTKFSLTVIQAELAVSGLEL